MDIAKIGIEIQSKGALRTANLMDKVADSSDRLEQSVTRGMPRVNRGFYDGSRSASDFARELLNSDRAGNRFAGGMSGVEQSVQQVGRGAGVASRALGILGTALTALGTNNAVGQMADFEQSLSRVQAITRSTTDQMFELEREARKLGATTSFSAAQAAEGMQYLGMAGFNTSQIIKAMPSTLALAKAGALELGTAADIASNALSSFGLQADKMGSVADTLAAAASRSNTNVQQLGEAMSYAAPIARSMGISIQETAAAVGVLSDNGIQASRAGTGMMGVIRQLTVVTKDGADVLATYGLSTEDVNIKTHGLQTVLERLSKTGMGTSDIFRLFGTEAGGAAAVLLNTTGRVESLTGELNTATGAAEEAARVMGDNLRGDLSVLGSTVSELILLTDEKGGITAKLRSMTQATIEAVGGFSDLISAGGQKAEMLRAVAAGVTAVGVAYGSFAIATRGATAAQAAFNVVAALNPYAVIAAAAIAAAGAIYTFIGAQQRQIEAVESMWEQAAKSTAGYEAAQSRIRIHQETLQELHNEEFKNQQELNRLRTKGFKRWSADARKAEALERKISDSRKQRMALLDAQANAEKAQSERRIANAEREKEAQRLQTVAEEAAAEAARRREEALEKLNKTSSASVKLSKELSDEEKWHNKLMREGEALTQRMRSATEVYADEQQRLNELKAIGAINDETYKRAMAETEKTLKEATERTKDIVEQANPMAQAWENAINRIDGTFADLFRSAFDGFKEFSKSIKETFKNLLAELAYMAVKNKIMIGVGMSGTAVAGGGLLDVGTSLLGGVGDLISGKGFSGISSGITALKGLLGGNSVGFGIGETLFNLGNSGMLGGTGVGSFLTDTAFKAAGISNLGLGLAGLGGGLLGSMAGGHGGIGGSLGSTAGMIFGGPIGAAIGSVLGSTIGSLFGSKWQEYIKYTQLTHDDGQIGGFNYREEKRKRGWKTSYRRHYDPLDAELKDGLNSQYDALVESVQSLFGSIGVDVSDAMLRGVEQSGLTINAGTSAEKAQELIAEWFGGITENMVTAVDESLDLNRLTQLATSLTGANEILETLNVGLFETSKKGAELAEQLIAMSGGMNAMAEQATFFYENFYSEEEKLERTSTALEEAFASIHRQVPRTRDEFRAVVESLDLTTEFGRKTYAVMMQLAPAFEQVARAADEAKRESEALHSSMIDDVKRLWDAFNSQSQGMEQQLLKLLGDDTAALAAQREIELQSIEESLRPFQERIWALQDEQKANLESAAAAQQAAAQQERYRSELARASEQLNGVLSSIQGWIDARTATSGSPTSNLEQSRKQFNDQLSLAKSGDFGALQSLTQYADRYLQSAEGMFASGPEAQRIEQEILAAMKGLDSISPYEFLAEEIKSALKEQTESLHERLHNIVISKMPTDSALTSTLLNQLQNMGDSQLTVSQVRSALNGKATDLEIRRLIRQVDTNADGIITAAEADAAATNNVLAAELAKTSAYIGNKQLTAAQVRAALAGKATNAEIDRLIQRADVNADGIISSAELSSLRINANLNASLAKQLSILGGKQLTVAQVRTALAGKATDAQINSLIREVDTNGDGIITATEMTAARVNSLLPGFHSAISQLGHQIDTSLDGALNMNEFMSAFKGMATDAELRRIFAVLDANGDGTISLLDEVVASTDSVGSSTSGIELEAKRQLEALRQHRAEMERQTSQFVEINSTMGSLRDAIMKLTHLEQEKAAAEAAAEEVKRREEAKLSKIRELETQRYELTATADSASQVIQRTQDTIDRAAAHRDTWVGNKLHYTDRAVLDNKMRHMAHDEFMAWMATQGYVRGASGFHGLMYDYGMDTSKIMHATREQNSANSSKSYAEKKLAELEAEIERIQNGGAFATGGAFTNGIVSRPTAFSMGVMGEAGPEAIMPLANVGGSLGVRVVKDENDEELAELRKQNQMLQATIQVLQSGFNKLIEKADESNESLDEINRNARLNGRVA